MHVRSHHTDNGPIWDAAKKKVSDFAEFKLPGSEQVWKANCALISEQLSLHRVRLDVPLRKSLNSAMRVEQRAPPLLRNNSPSLPNQQKI